MPAGLEAFAAKALREHQAKEIVRQRQQGFGRPIISVKHGDYRLVFVNNKVCWSRSWTYFTDFLLDHLKDTLGRDWGMTAQARGIDHPIFRWLRLLQAKAGLSSSPSEGVREVGYVSSLFRLGYALYLIAHHDQIAPAMIKRLQKPGDDVFRPAVYETFVAAAFAVAGFQIEGAEQVRTHRTTPEFWAISPSGTRYAVEAKCKLNWRVPCDARSSDFREELRAWVRGKLYDASRKRLPSPVFWFELSIPAAFDETAYRIVRDVVLATLGEAENLTVDGEPAAPAYVFVTNHSHLVSDLVKGSPFFAMLGGYRKPDMSTPLAVSLEEAFDTRDRHREITRVFECFSEVQRVPMTFDGEPVEFAEPNGEPGQSLKIGNHIQLDFPDGQVLAETLKEITVSDKIAWVGIEDPSGHHRIATMPLSDVEMRAFQEYGLAAFGKPEGPSRNLENDPIRLYDWLLEVYSGYPRDGLLRQISQHSKLNEIAALPLPELRRRVAREVAAGMYSMSSQRSDKRATAARRTSSGRSESPP